MEDRKYYHAYDDRYRQVHGAHLRWFFGNPSPVVADVMERFAINKQHKILEIGCGEGRDAFPLLTGGFDLLATDVSPQAIAFCRRNLPAYSDRFQILDCVTENLEESFDFIYAVAVLHMLVPDEDRDALYTFVRKHLTQNGIGLICTMGDGNIQRKSNIATAFDLQERVHEETGKVMKITGTSCCMINFDTFELEIRRNGLILLEKGMAAEEPNFPMMMYAVVKRR